MARASATSLHVPAPAALAGGFIVIIARRPRRCMAKRYQLYDNDGRRHLAACGAVMRHHRRLINRHQRRRCRRYRACIFLDGKNALFGERLRSGRETDGGLRGNVSHHHQCVSMKGES